MAEIGKNRGAGVNKMENPKKLFEISNRFFNCWAAWAAPSTLFWIKSSTPNGTRIREDHFFGFARVFFRKPRRYVWTLTLGRLRIYLLIL